MRVATTHPRLVVRQGTAFRRAPPPRLTPRGSAQGQFRQKSGGHGPPRASPRRMIDAHGLRSTGGCRPETRSRSAGSRLPETAPPRAARNACRKPHQSSLEIQAEKEPVVGGFVAAAWPKAVTARTTFWCINPRCSARSARPPPSRSFVEIGEGGKHGCGGRSPRAPAGAHRRPGQCRHVSARSGSRCPARSRARRSDPLPARRPNGGEEGTAHRFPFRFGRAGRTTMASHPPLRGRGPLEHVCSVSPVAQCPVLGRRRGLELRPRSARAPSPDEVFAPRARKPGSRPMYSSPDVQPAGKAHLPIHHPRSCGGCG